MDDYQHAQQLLSERRGICCSFDDEYDGGGIIDVTNLDDLELIANLDNSIILYEFIMQEHANDDDPLDEWNDDIVSAKVDVDTDYLERRFSNEIHHYLANERRRDEKLPVGIKLFVANYGILYRYSIVSYMDINDYVYSFIRPMTEKQLNNMKRSSERHSRREMLKKEEELADVEKQVNEEIKQAQDKVRDQLLDDPNFASCTNQTMRKEYCYRHFNDELWIEAFSPFNYFTENHRGDLIDCFAFNFANRVYQEHFRKKKD